MTIEIIVIITLFLIAIIWTAIECKIESNELKDCISCGKHIEGYNVPCYWYYGIRGKTCRFFETE